MKKSAKTVEYDATPTSMESSYDREAMNRKVDEHLKPKKGK